MAVFSSSVPAAAVYLVKFRSSASMAACLILAGVGKSGSPAPKSTTSTPLARRFSASAATFMVDDTLMNEIRSAIPLTATFMSPLKLSLTCLLELRNAPAHARLNQRRRQAGDIPPQTENLLHP